MGKILRLSNWKEKLYKIHLLTGLVAALWLILVAITGVMINHQESLGLLDVEISDRYLPDSYRPDMRTGTTRLNIIVTDLHSGRFFGANGHWVGDLIALLLLVSLFTGVGAYFIKRALAKQKVVASIPRISAKPGNGEQRWPLPVKTSGPAAAETPADTFENGPEIPADQEAKASVRGRARTL